MDEKERMIYRARIPDVWVVDLISGVHTVTVEGIMVFIEPSGVFISFLNNIIPVLICVSNKLGTITRHRSSVFLARPKAMMSNLSLEQSMDSALGFTESE